VDVPWVGHFQMKLDEGRRVEAQKLFREANKLSNPSFLGFRIKGDWITSTPLYERAALLFRVCV